MHRLFTQIEVVIRFQICIFDILNTATKENESKYREVVIRFQICIFDILNTATKENESKYREL